MFAFTFACGRINWYTSGMKKRYLQPVILRDPRVVGPTEEGVRTISLDTLLVSLL